MKYVLALALTAVLAMPSVALAQSDAQIDQSTMDAMAADASMQEIEAIAEAAAADAWIADNGSGIPSQLDIVIEKLDADAVKCGLDQNGIVSASEAALRYNRVRISKSPSSNYLYISTATVLNGPICVTAIDVQIQNHDWVSVDFRSDPIFATIVLGSSAGVMTSVHASNSHTYNINQIIKDLIERALSDIGDMG